MLFAQHRMWHERDRIQALLDQGAIVFVCGDGVRMAPAVRATLTQIHQDATGCSNEDASLWLRDLERAGRYVPDVFGA